jgi:hypothetical protein
VLALFTRQEMEQE